MFTQRHLKDGTIGPSKFSTRNYKYAFDTFQAHQICTASVGYGDPTGTATNINHFYSGSYPNVIEWEYTIIGTQTILAPVLGASGLGVELDKTNNDGVEYIPGGSTARGRFAFTIGTDPAFFARLKFKQSDVSGSDELIFGVRKRETVATAYTTYTDYAAIGQVTQAASADIKTVTRLNTGVAGIVDTTQNWADGETHTLGVDVGPTGKVMFSIDGAFPTVTQAFTFDDADVVVPFLHIIHTAEAGDIDIVEFEAGYRPLRNK
jgi:hypothetical protein